MKGAGLSACTPAASAGRAAAKLCVQAGRPGKRAQSSSLSAARGLERGPRELWRPLRRALSGRHGLVGSCSRHCQHTHRAPQKHNLWVPSLGWTRSGPECTTFPSPVGALELCHSALIRDGQILGKVRPRAVRLPDSGTATEAPVAAAQHEVWDEHAGERDAASGCLGGTGDTRTGGSDAH